MTGSKGALIKYRLFRSKDTFDDAKILADKKKEITMICSIFLKKR